MSYISKPYILFGGDFNPEQWDRATLEKDLLLLKNAGVNTLTLPVFAWAKMEPEEGRYEFDWLDEILDRIEAYDMKYFLATPTCAQPAWLSRKYPEVLPVDIAGRKRTHGMRVFFCYNSPKFRERAAALATAMADRFRFRKGLSGWHVANEYGTKCYCEICQKKFRQWLVERYGTINSLNEHWHTTFWGRQVYSFEEVMLPTELNDDYRFNPAVALDYQRFVTDSTIECFENEARILKKARPDLPVFTNISGYIKKLDQFKMVPHMDVAGWDNYPWPTDDPGFPAMKHDIMRAANGGRSFYVMEQSPNQQNWQPYNKIKRPGEVRRIAYQGLAHGSDSSMYFQMHQSIAGQEKFHGAIIGRNGDGNTRIYREIMDLGEELARLEDRFIGGRTPAEVGILFDWDNWWALELASGPTKDMDYLQEVFRYYKPLYDMNVPVDIVRYQDDLSKYKVLIAPMLYMMKDHIGEKIDQFVKDGGVLLATYMTGYVDENDRCVYGAYPGPLRKALGLWVEETDALRPEETNTVCIGDRVLGTCSFLCDLVNLETAKAEAVYGEDFYADHPVITSNKYGRGRAWYIASRLEDKVLKQLVRGLLKSRKVEPVFESKGEIEITVRESKKGKTYFLINHGTETASVDLGSGYYGNLLNHHTMQGEIFIAAGDVMVLMPVHN